MEMFHSWFYSVRADDDKSMFEINTRGCYLSLAVCNAYNDFDIK